MPNRIIVLAPERLHEIIETESKAGRRKELAFALLNLMELHCSYLKGGRPMQGTILPCTQDPRGGLHAEIAWGIIQNPRPGPYGGMQGDHVLNGALVQHSNDLRWSNHT